MLPRLSLFLLALFIFAPLRGQDEPVHMRPEFPLVFPLDQKGRNVTVKYPVLINPATVIKPGMVLRVLYVMTTINADGSSDLVLAHKGDMEEAYSRPSGGDSGPKLPPEVAHELEGYRRTVWEVANNFVLAMAQMPTDAMHLIYSPTGKNSDVQDERFGFFDGLFVGQPNGKVTVIAVERDSRAERAGIKAGDEILSVGGMSTQNDLATFAAGYANAKKVAKDNEVDSYAVVIRPENSPDIRTIAVSMPPRLGGALMDGFDSNPAPASPH